MGTPINQERAVRAEAAPLIAELPGMTAVIASMAMRHLMAMARKVASTEFPVLITGESGAGKELIARAIHEYSARSAKPFVDVNCAALPEHLVESELFGYERGAFSGADCAKPGLFEVAQGGTLFLDEIGELDLRMQAKLLRVLDGQTWFRLGGIRKIQSDVRIVAATNLILDEALRSRKFRQDLYHRLDVVHLRVPALRERADDVAPLAEYFLRGTPFSLSPEALSILEGYSWPGNVRELKNALCKATLFSSTLEIRPGDLPAEVKRRTPARLSEYSLNGIEESAIFKVLAQTGGHQQRAADLLGISRRTLIRKLKVYRSGKAESVA